MRIRAAGAVAAAAAVLLASCSSSGPKTPPSTTSTTARTVPTPTLTPPPTTPATTTGSTTGSTAGPPPTAASATTGGGPVGDLPVAVSRELTSDQQDSSILVPSSCRLQGGVVTARGTVRGILAEVYIRYGDVVELYAYSAAGTAPNGSGDVQVLDLSSETPGQLVHTPAWVASAPVASGFPPPLQCLVAVQSTHAFMGAGNAGG